jgi:hypothetical protein
MYSVQKATKGLKNFLKELSMHALFGQYAPHYVYMYNLYIVGTRDWEYTIRDMLYVLNTYMTIIKKENTGRK